MRHEEPARVIAVTAGKATVEMDRTKSCGSCGLCAATGGSRMRLVLDAIDGLSAGQTVIVAIDRTVSLRSVFLLFGLPLAGLVGGVLIGHRWPVLGIGTEGSAAALGVLFLILAFLGVRGCEHRSRAKHVAPPSIVRILPE